MYIYRNLEKSFISSSTNFPVMLLTGPRQVGKTTFLKHIDSSRTYVTLDTPRERGLAKEDPELFLQTFSPPILIDEIQYAPELLPFIKVMVDNKQQDNLFWLTGSQQFQMMKGVTESLAGRVGILEIPGLSNAELEKRNNPPFLPDIHFENRERLLDLKGLYERIWRGSYPRLYNHSEMDKGLFYESYINTYLERDVMQLGQVSQLHRLYKFMRSCAARTGQLLNYSNLAEDAEVSVNTAKKWLNILVASHLIYLLEPYHNNLLKRMTKQPKLYFLDTGLATHLAAWSSPEVLEAGSMSGAIFETWCVSEIIKSYQNNGKHLPFYFYRDYDKVEIDLIIEQDNTLYPVEFKKSSNPPLKAIKHFSALEKLNKPIGPGAVVCMSQSVFPLNSNNKLIPAYFI